MNKLILTKPDDHLGSLMAKLTPEEIEIIEFIESEIAKRRTIFFQVNLKDHLPPKKDGELTSTYECRVKPQVGPIMSVYEALGWECNHWSASIHFNSKPEPEIHCNAREV